MAHSATGSHMHAAVIASGVNSLAREAASALSSGESSFVMVAFSVYVSVLVGLIQVVVGASASVALCPEKRFAGTVHAQIPSGDRLGASVALLGGYGLGGGWHISLSAQSGSSGGRRASES